MPKTASARRTRSLSRTEMSSPWPVLGPGWGAAFRRSDLEEAERSWKDALEHAEKARDERVGAGILRSLAIAAGSRGDQLEAGRLLDRAIHSAEDAKDDQLLRLLLGSRAEISKAVTERIRRCVPLSPHPAARMYPECPPLPGHRSWQLHTVRAGRPAPLRPQLRRSQRAQSLHGGAAQARRPRAGFEFQSTGKARSGPTSTRTASPVSTHR